MNIDEIIFDELELRHLASYKMGEENGLLVQTKARLATSKGKPMGYKVGRMIGLSARTGVEVVLEPGENSIEFDLKDITPIVRSLNSLIEEITIGEEKFIPLKRLLNEKDAKRVKSFGIRKTYLDSDKKHLLGILADAYDGKGKVILAVWIDRIMFWNNKSGVIEKLKEWDFDIHGLLENNLAINYNDYLIVKQ